MNFAGTGSYLGIDFGTSGARAVAIDAAGNVQAEVRQAFSHIESPLVWRSALFELIGQIPGPIRQNLKAICIDGTSATALLCDSDNEPLGEALLYHDSRAHEQAVELCKLAPSGHITASASSSLAKLMWLAGQPEAIGARYFLHQADWLASQLSGHPGVSDWHNALKLGYDPAAQAYPDWILGLPVAHLLPQVVEPGSLLGTISARAAYNLFLPRDCMVRAGTTDSIAAFLASGAKQPGQAVTSLGSTLVLKLLSEQRVDAAQYGIYSHRLGKLWLAGGASNCGGAVLKAYFSDQQLADLSQRINPEIASPLNYYPLPKPGERFPINDPNMAPRLIPRPDDDAAFLHGLLESLARIEAQGYRLLAELGTSPLSEVLTAGGGAQNATWARIRNRVLGVPVSAAAHTEAAYGTALLAARGTDLLSFAA